MREGIENGFLPKYLSVFLNFQWLFPALNFSSAFSGIGKGGTGTLKMDGKVTETKRMEKTLPITLQWDESFENN